MLDVTVGLVILSLTLVGGFRYLTTIAETSETSLTRGQLRRELAIIGGTFDSDIGSAVPCAAAGGGVVAEINNVAGAGAESVVLWSDANGDGTPDLVGWRLANGSLERGVANAAGSCSALTVGAMTWTRVVLDARAGSNGFGRAVANGAVSAYAGPCTATNAPSCPFTSLQINFIAAIDPDSGPATFDTTWALPTGANRFG